VSARIERCSYLSEQLSPLVWRQGTNIAVYQAHKILIFRQSIFQIVSLNKIDCQRLLSNQFRGIVDRPRREIYPGHMRASPRHAR